MLLGGRPPGPRQVGGACGAGPCTHPVTWLWGLCPLTERSRWGGPAWPTSRLSQALCFPRLARRCTPGARPPRLWARPGSTSPGAGGRSARPLTPIPRPARARRHPTQPLSSPSCSGQTLRAGKLRAGSRPAPVLSGLKKTTGGACRKSWGNGEGRRDEMHPRQHQAPGFLPHMAGGDIAGPRGQQGSGSEGKAVPESWGGGVAVMPRVR